VVNNRLRDRISVGGGSDNLNYRSFRNERRDT
jgi:hypothetical protein